MRIAHRSADVRSRRRRVAPLIACAAVSFAHAESAAAVTTSQRIRLPFEASALSVEGRGAARALLTHRSRTLVSLELAQVGAGTARDSGTPLLTYPHSFNARTPIVAAGLTRRGAIAASEVQAAPGRRRSIEVVSVTLGGRPSKPQRISANWGSASEPEVLAGGDAAAVLFFQHRPKSGRRLMWAYRPAGATRFLPARALTQVGEYQDFRYVVKLGPTGDGAVLQTTVFPDGTPPPFRLRRLRADGSIGPWFPVSDAGFEDGVGELAIGPDGTIAIAVAADRRIGQGGESAVVATSLAPGSSVPTAPQLLEVDPASSDDQTALPDFSLQLATGRGGQTALATTPDGSGRIRLYTGPAHQLRLAADFKAPGIDIARAITVTRDGGVTAVWEPNPTFSASPMMATHQPPRGSFSAPSTVARTAYKGEGSELAPSFLAPVGRRGALLGYVDSQIEPERSATHLVTISP